MALRPRRRWTNNLAWAVWVQRDRRKRQSPIQCKTPAYHFTTGTDSLRLGELYTGNVQVYVMSPTGSNAGLPAGAPALTANKWQVITVTLNNSNLLVNSAATGVDLYLYAFRYNGNTYYVNMGDTSTGYVGVLDGLTQYWTLSDPILLSGDFKIQFETEHKKPVGDSAYVGGSGGSGVPNAFTIFAGNNGSMNVQLPRSVGGTAYLSITVAEGAKYDHCTVTLEKIGTLYTISQTTAGVTASDILNDANVLDLSITQLLRWSNALFNDVYIRNLKIWNEATLIVDLPLTDKDAGATQLGANGTSINATCINYTADIWRPVFE